MIIELLAAAGGDAPKNQFGFMEAMNQGGFVAWFILGAFSSPSCSSSAKF